MRNKKYAILAFVTGVVLLLDQMSKMWIRKNINEGGHREMIAGFFQLVHVENPGAAWGIFSDATHRIPFFIVATLVAFVVIGIYFYKLPAGQSVVTVAMSMILGGAIGNFIDRMHHHEVTDFLDFYISIEPIRGWLKAHVGSFHWPSFNVADMAIVAGLLLIMLDMFVLEGRREREAAPVQKGGRAARPSPEGDHS